MAEHSAHIAESRLATFISYAINPLVLPPILFGIVVYNSGGSRGQISGAVAIAVVFFCLVPLASMVRAIRGKPAATIELRDRTHRTMPYLISVASYLAALAVLTQTSLPARGFLLAVTLAFVWNGVLLLIINLYWKISLHVSTLAGFFSILWFYSTRVIDHDGSALVFAVVAVVVTALVMWARVEADAHTEAQVIGGAVFGFLMPYVLLLVLAQTGLFDTL